MPRGYSTKYDTIYAFMDHLLQFRDMYPEIDHSIKGMISSHSNINKSGYCPFRFMKEDPVIGRIKKLYGATFPIMLWNIEWEDVNVISWHYPFLMLINNWYDDYDVYHKELGDEIMYSTLWIPQELVIEKKQTTFLLRK